MASFAHNEGEGNFQNSTLLKKINNHEDPPGTILEDFGLYNKGKDKNTGKLVVVPRLIKRRSQ